MGTAKIGDREVVHEAVPAEDRMQAFLWRHLLPAETLPALVFDPAYQPPADRIRPEIRDEDRPKGVKPTLTRSSVEYYLRQVERLYQEWYLTEEFANRKGIDGPITLSFKDLPAGLELPGATLAAKQEVVGLALKTSLTELEKPVNLTVVGTAKIGDREVVHQAVPAEDRMQAFLWHHLLPADTLPALVFDPSYKPAADRIRPEIRAEDRPKDVKPTLTRSSVDYYLRQVERLYQEWFLTEEFVNREIANIEARLIK